MASSANAQDPGPVIVCCSRAEASSVQDALSELEGLGHTVEIVDGVEDDARRLAPVIERFHGDGLYVLCRSPELGRGTIEQLREVLLAQHVPFGRTLTVATRRPRDLVDRVKASLARASTRRAREPEPTEAPAPKAAAPAPPTPAQPKAVAAPPKTAARPAPKPTSPPAASATEGTVSMLAPRPPAGAPSRRRPFDEDAVTGVQKAVDPVVSRRPRRATIQNLAPPPVPGSARHRSTHEVDFDPPTEPLPPAEARRRDAADDDASLPSVPPPPPDSAAISMTDAVVDLHEHDPETSMLNASLDQLDFSDLDAGRAATGPHTIVTRRDPSAVLPADVMHSPVGPIRTGNTHVSPAPRRPEPEPELPAPPSAPPPPSAPAPETVVAAAPRMPPAPAERPPAAPPRPSAPSTPPPAPPASVTPSPAPTTSPSSGGAFASASVSTPAGAAASSTVAPDDAPPTSRALWWAAGLGAVVIATVALAVAFSGDDTPDDAQADASATKADAAGDGSTPAGQDGKNAAGSPSKAGDAKAGDDAATDADDPDVEPGATIVALADRKVRALDVLLVQPASAGPMSHADAERYCTDLELAGIPGWRLPEVGELSSLDLAGMVGRASYWSSTSGDTFGDIHFVWNARRDRAEQRNDASLVVCVRDDRQG